MSFPSYSSSSSSSTVRRHQQAALTSSRLASETARGAAAQSVSADGEEVDKYGKTSAGQLTALLHTAMWCSAAAFITWYADLIPTLLYSDRINRSKRTAHHQHPSLSCCAAPLPRSVAP